MNGITVNEVITTKYLCIMIYNSLTWSDHIDYIYIKIVKF